MSWAELYPVDVFIFSDGGFIDEVNALAATGMYVIVARLHRKGYTFEHDSRDYIYPPNSVDIYLEDDMIHEGVCKLLDLIDANDNAFASLPCAYDNVSTFLPIVMDNDIDPPLVK
jgi:hypothetical protein